MSASRTELHLTIDGQPPARLVIGPGEYVLGESPDTQIRIESAKVAPRHARLIVEPGHAVVEDLGSGSGTFINGSPVTRPTRVWPGQKVQLGSAVLELRRMSDPEDLDATITPQAAALQRLAPTLGSQERRYDIGAQVARGGMGAILSAKEVAIRRTVAMKVMLDGQAPEDMARFVEEAQVTGQLEHPNIVPVHELSIGADGQPFYTMKMVRGITLKKVLDLMASGTGATLEKYPLPALLTIFQKVCDAVAFAHSKGVIHRDLKPENIMLGDFGEVLVMDWGLAKVLDARNSDGGTRQEEAVFRSTVLSVRSEQGASGSTMAGTILGTPQYMSPEQARGEVETLDARSDIYALGAILYHLLALRPPVTGSDAMDIVQKVARGQIEPLDLPPRSTPARGSEKARTATGSRGKLTPPPAGANLPGGRIPDSLAAVTRKAMALDRDARYATVPDLQADITAYQGGFATSAENASLWKQGVLLVKRHKAAFSTAAAAWALITALAVWFVLNLNAERRRVAHQRDRAEQERARAEAGERRAEESLGLANAHLLRVKIEKAREAFDSDRADEGLAWLAAVLRQDPGNRFAPSWLISALTERNFPIPSGPPIVVERAADAKDESSTLVRFSPDGRRVFFNSGYQAFGVWDVATGSLVWPQLVRGNIGNAEFSKDGKTLFLRAVGRFGPHIESRETETGRFIARTASPHPAEITKLVLSPEGTLLVTGDKSGEIRVWDARTLAQVGEPFRGPDETYQVAISTDDRWLAGRFAGGHQVHVWDLRTGKSAIEPLENVQGDTLCFHPTSSVLLLGAINNTSRPILIDLADGRRVETNDKHLFSNPHPAFSPDGSRFATGGADDRVRVWDAHNGAPVTPWFHHGGDVHAPQFSPEGLRLFTTSWDQTCRLWDTRTGLPITEPMTLPGYSVHTGQCWLSPNGTRVATPARRGLLQLWDVRDGRWMPLHVARFGTTKSLSFSPDGAWVIAGSTRDNVRVFDPRTGKTRFADLMHTNATYATAFSPDGKWIATGSHDHTARIWDARTGKPASAPLEHEFAVSAVAFTPDSRLLATVAIHKTRFVRFWQVETGAPATPPVPLRGHVPRADTLRFSPDGRFLAVPTESGTELLEVAAGKIVRTFMTRQNTLEADFSPDGSRIAVATLYDGALVFDVATGEQALPPLPHENAVTSIHYNREGTMLLSASTDGTARIWDAKTGAPIGAPLRHATEVREAIFSPDGSRIATRTANGDLRLWDTQTCQPLSEPLRHPGPVDAIAFIPDGNRLAYAFNSANRVIEVPPLPLPAPAWLPELAEAVAGRRVDETGQLVPVKDANFPYLRLRLGNAAGGHLYAQWAAWFFADRATRQASPWRDAPLTEEIQRILADGGESGRLLVLRHEPGHSEALAALAADIRSGGKGRPQADAETFYAASTYAQLQAGLAAQRAAGTPAYTTEAGMRGFPKRDPACTPRQLDLTRHFTHLLDVPWHSSDTRYHLSALPKSLHTLDGIAWDTRGVVQVFGEKIPRAFPVRVEGIPAGQRFHRLHALMGTGAKAPDGTRVGHFRLRYADGTSRELPIVYGEDVRDWSMGTDKAETTRAREAWRLKSDTATLRLFHATFDNPRPDAEVAVLDLVSAKADAAPFVVALTVE